MALLFSIILSSVTEQYSYKEGVRSSTSESYKKKGKRCALSLSKYTYFGIQMDGNTSQMWNTLHKHEHITNVDPKANFKSVGR